MEFVKRNIKIYIVSGKSNSGKDTVANIIKEKFVNKKVVSLAYASYLKMYAEEVLGWDGNDSTKPREFLQTLGVELIKKQINDKMLINRIIEDIKVYSYFYDIVVITDARFPEEIENIKNEFDNVTVIHMCDRGNELTEAEKMHATEVSLDGYHNYDYEINNNGTLEELKEKVNEIVGETYDSRG